MEMKFWTTFLLSIGTVSLGLIVYYIILVYWKRLRARYLLRKCPTYTPPGLPVLGHLFQLASLSDTADFWKYFSYNQQKEKQTILWLGHILYLIVTTVDVAEAVLSSPDAVEKAHAYRILTPISDGVFSAETNRWRKLRKKLNLMFSPKLLETYMKDINEQTAILLEQMKTQGTKNYNILHFLGRFFYDIVSRTHFGVETHDQVDKKDEVTRIASKMVEFLITTRSMKPHLHYEWTFKLTKDYQHIVKLRRNAIAAVKRLITRSLAISEKELKEGVERYPTYIEYVRDALSELKMEPTLNNLYFNSADLLIAGSDTTSVAVSECFYYLSQYPDVQQKVFEEVLTIYGEDKHRAMTKDDLARMTYLDMVIKEVLRLASPPGVIRETTRDLNLGEYTIPKGTNVYIFIQTLHKNPEYYEKPNEFYPEHFLPENIKKRPKMAYMPFSMGPRNCPGSAFAYMTLKTVTSAVVRNYVIECDTPLEKVKYKLVLMQEQVDGYVMRFIPRQ